MISPLKLFRVFLLPCFLLLAEASSGQVSNATTRFATQPALAGASISAVVTDMITGEVIQDFDGSRRLCPASVWKLATTAAALEVLGSDFRFRTALAWEGKIENGTLIGDLIIVGGGDPSLGSRHIGAGFDALYAQWVSAIQAAGIDSIRGRVIGNAAHFQGDGIPRTRIWEDMANYYGTGVSGLSIHDNTYFVEFSTLPEPGQPAQLKRVHPAVPGLEITSEVMSSAAQADKAFIFGTPYDTRRVISGTLPLGKTSYEIKGSLPDPALFAAFHLCDRLEKVGIPVSGGPEAEHQVPRELPTLKILSEHLSPPLAALVAHTNKVSDNLFAETLLYQLGAQAGAPTLEGGLAALAAQMAKMTYSTKPLFFYDGSGLSRYTAVSARHMASVLSYARKSPKLKTDLLDRLPMAGKEGSMRYFAADGPLSGNLRGKSGSMEKVRCYAGYFTAKTGREVGFAVLVNNFDGNPVEVRGLIEKWLEEVYRGY